MTEIIHILNILKKFYYESHSKEKIGIILCKFISLTVFSAIHSQFSYLLVLIIEFRKGTKFFTWGKVYLYKMISIIVKSIIRLTM